MRLSEKYVFSKKSQKSQQNKNDGVPFSVKVKSDRSFFSKRTQLATLVK